MKFTSAIASIIALTLPLTYATQLSYDETYDVGSTSLDNVACSDGSNGVENLGYKKFSDLPDFPYIGGAAAIEGYNSVNCGNCYHLKYTNSKGKNSSIDFLAIDHTDSGFNIGLKAMNDLTGGQAEHIGIAQVTWTHNDPSVCGL